MTDQPQDGQPRPLRFLTVQQVADELNTKHNTIRALIASGDLPAIQIGGRGQWRIERAKLEEYITAAYARGHGLSVQRAVFTAEPVVASLSVA